MSRNQIVNSVGQVRLWLLSLSLIIFIWFNLSQADSQTTSSWTNSTGKYDKYLKPIGGQASNGSLEASAEMAESFEPRISNGHFARRGEFPFHVGVYIDGGYVCGGVLVADGRILTLKSCVEHESNRYQIKVGDHDIDEDDGEQTYDVIRKAVDPMSELAMLFTEPIEMGVGLNPVYRIKLPSHQHQIFTRALTITGWGAATMGGPYSVTLKKAKVYVRNCNQPSEGYFCSKGTNMSPCIGDAGGPIFDNNVKQLAGIQAGLIDCSESCSGPKCMGKYIDISQHLQWIRRFI